MFFQNTLDEKITENEKKIKDLKNRLESINFQSDSFFEELEVTEEQLSSFISDENNFTKENWDQLQKEKKKLDDKLNVELANIKNPLKSKKNLASLHVAQHWLHVR